MQLPDISTTASKLGRVFKPWHRQAFAGTFLCGLGVHLYLFTNMLLNMDTVSRVFYSMDEIVGSGRWLLKWACFPSSYVITPLLTGLLGLLYLACTAVVVVELLGVKKRLPVFLIALTMASFPTVASTFAYIIMSDGYLLGLFFSAVAVLIARRWKWGFLIGAALITLSLGIYQAYLAFAATLILLVLLLELLEGDIAPKKWLWGAARYAAMGALAVLANTFIIGLTQRFGNVPLVDYQNIDVLAASPLEQVQTALVNLPRAYQSIGILDIPGFFGAARVAVLAVYALLVAALGGYAVYKTRLWRTPWKLCAAIACVVALPLAMNLSMLLSKEYHNVMRMPYSLWFMLLAVGMDRLPARQTFPKIMRWAAPVLTLAICFQFIVTTNVAYTNMTLRMEKADSIITRLVDRIEGTEGYRKHTPLVIVGRLSYDIYDNASDLDHQIWGMTGAVNNIIVHDNPQHVLQYMKDYHGFEPLVSGLDPAEVAKDPRVQAMEPFPNYNSVQVIDDVMVVKLSEPEEG